MASSEVRPKDFDVQAEESEPVRVMAVALDRVLDLLPENLDRAEVRREAALFIVDQFRQGEHDPDRLTDLALAELSPTGRELDDAGLVPIGDEADSRTTEDGNQRTGIGQE
jgi:hypothetical protein